MLHCSRRKQHRRLADCIHTHAGSAVPLSDNITLGEVSTSDIDKVIRLNRRMKELKLPFYAVCGRGGKPSFRRVGESCVDEKNIAYLSPTDLSKRLQKHYGISLEALRNDPLNELRKKVEEKTEEQRTEKQKEEKQKTNRQKEEKPTKQQKTTDEKERIERLRKRRSAHRTRTTATGKTNEKDKGTTSGKSVDGKPTTGKPAAPSTDKCAGCEADDKQQSPTTTKQSETPSETEQQRQERIARDLQKVVKALEGSVKKAA